MLGDDEDEVLAAHSLEVSVRLADQFLSLLLIPQPVLSTA
jgi:hypothetical protein